MSSVAAAFDACPPEHAERGARLSLLKRGPLLSIGRCLQEVRGLPGDTAEVGIASGGTTRLIAAGSGGRRHWACDTFDGLADVGAHDAGLTNKMFQNVLPPVREELADLANVRIVAGYFPASADAEMRGAAFAFVHIDVDTYQSILNCFEFFAPRMVPGGLIALDDVLPKDSGCPGAQRAWREIYAQRPRSWAVFSETPPQIVVRFA